jgi:FeS assembly protein IscX
MEEWRLLYQAFDKFKNTKCWEWMTDSEIFGVQESETGRVNYCNVLGNAGLLFGMNLYHGREGLDTCIGLATGDISVEEYSGGQMAELNWTDTEEIALRLMEAHPTVDPLTVRFTDLHRWVTQLEGFTGDPKDSNEKKLEAIQMAWCEEYKESTE